MNKEVKLVISQPQNPYVSVSSGSSTSTENRRPSNDIHNNTGPEVPTGKYRPTFEGGNRVPSPSTYSGSSHSNSNLPDLTEQFSGGSDSFNSSKGSGDNMDR